MLLNSAPLFSLPYIVQTFLEMLNSLLRELKDLMIRKEAVAKTVNTSKNQ